MILTDLNVDIAELERRTGWAIKPQGACKGPLCVPLPESGETVDARTLSERLGMPLVAEEGAGLWALGPDSLGRALHTADAPALTLPEWRGGDWSLTGMRGQKVFLLAWASW